MLGTLEELEGGQCGGGRWAGRDWYEASPFKVLISLAMFSCIMSDSGSYRRFLQRGGASSGLRSQDRSGFSVKSDGLEREGCLESTTEASWLWSTRTVTWFPMEQVRGRREARSRATYREGRGLVSGWVWHAGEVPDGPSPLA